MQTKPKVSIRRLISMRKIKNRLYLCFVPETAEVFALSASICCVDTALLFQFHATTVSHADSARRRHPRNGAWTNSGSCKCKQKTIINNEIVNTTQHNAVSSHLKRLGPLSISRSYIVYIYCTQSVVWSCLY